MADAALLRVCIIGAGSSGVAMAKALKEKGIAFDCFEIGSDIGGMWRYENDNGLSSAYRSLHIDTSRNNLGYSDFPIADHYPDFLSHAQVLEHLQAYADRFGVRPHIRFKTRVEEVRPDPARRLEGATARRRRARAIARCWSRTATCGTRAGRTFPARFDGAVIHSHDYRTADPFKDKHVLVVGIGNSAVDIAVDVCRPGQEHYLVDAAQRLDHAQVHHGHSGGSLVGVLDAQAEAADAGDSRPDAPPDVPRGRRPGALSACRGRSIRSGRSMRR